MSHIARCWLAVLLFVSVSCAQSTFGSISGTVKDPSGSVVPGAAVEVINEGTGVTRQSVSSSAGVFNVPNLDIGSYRVRVSGSGFTTYERNILQGPPIRNLDLGLQKEFHYRERWQLRFMLTMVNALNHPSFSNPSANISSTGTVSVISGQTRPLIGEPGPREIDFGLRLTF
jgi:Carboxypeptidase regulatory-like domain